MINVAILEDENDVIQELNTCIERIFKENNFDVKISSFRDGKRFLSSFSSQYDLIFMDINMPAMDGMSVAREIRKIDQKVLIIFVTSLAQYAIEGYKVNAFDFILKPVTYNSFSLKLGRVIDYFKKNKENSILIKNKTSVYKIKTSDIKYIEVINHSLIYHTLQGNISTTGSLRKAKEELTGLPFELCNQCYLVNLKYVNLIEDFTIFVGQE